MTQFGPASAAILVGGRNLSSDTFMLNEDTEQVLEQTNGLGVTFEEHKPVGLARVMLEASGGLYEDAVLHNVESFQDQGATRQLVSFYLAGGAIGSEAVMLDGTYAATWKRMAARDALTKAHALHTITGDYKRGKILHGLTSETTTSGNTEGPSVDNTTSSANGLYADLHVPALTLGGFTSVTIKVRHSTDDISYTDLITFTVVTLPGTAQRAFIGGTINRHLAISWLFNGAGSGQSITPYVVANRA